MAKDFEELKYETEAKLVTGVWIIFYRQGGGYEYF